MKQKNGFTLLEILIAVGILSTVAILLTQVLVATTHANKKTELVQRVKESGSFSLDVIARIVRAGSSLATVCDAGETSTAAAVIRTIDNYEITLMCLSDGNAARIASVSGGTVSYLSSGDLTLSASGATDCADSSLAFSCPSVPGVATPLTVTFTLRQPGVAGSAYEEARASFHGTVNVRNE